MQSDDEKRKPTYEEKLEQQLAADPDYKSRTGKEGVDLNVVVRQILIEEMVNRGLSQNQLAKLLGLQQRSLGRFIAGDDGTSLKTLTQIVTELGDTLPSFLARHERFKRRRGGLQVIRDETYDRFRSVLTPSQQDRWLDTLDKLKAAGILASGLRALEEIHDMHQAGRREALRETQKKARAEKARQKATGETKKS